jgi:hypothetical protein
MMFKNNFREPMWLSINWIEVNLGRGSPSILASRSLSPSRAKFDRSGKNGLTTVELNLPKLFILSVVALLLVFSATGCSTASHPLAAVNLEEAGWTVRQGQAVWTLPHGGHNIAGEVVVATGSEGRAYVQFSKSPFPLVIGQATEKRWQVEFPAQNQRYGGSGLPPKRLLWLYLPRVLTGRELPPSWTWKDSDGNWRLENPATREVIEGFFAP